MCLFALLVGEASDLSRPGNEVGRLGCVFEVDPFDRALNNRCSHRDLVISAVQLDNARHVSLWFGKRQEPLPFCKGFCCGPFPEVLVDQARQVPNRARLVLGEDHRVGRRQGLGRPLKGVVSSLIDRQRRPANGHSVFLQEVRRK